MKEPSVNHLKGLPSPSHKEGGSGHSGYIINHLCFRTAETANAVKFFGELADVCMPSYVMLLM